MPYMNDMSTLAQVVSPVDASAQAGQMNLLQQQQEELANQKSLAQLPYAGPMAAADVASKQASTGLTQAQTQGMGLKNLFTQATQPGEVAKTNAENTNAVTASNAKNVGMIGQTIGQLANYLDGVPEAARPAMVKQILQNYNIPEDKIPPQLMSGDPNMWRGVGQGMVQQSAPYLTESMKQDKEYTKATDVAGISSDARVRAAELSADARVRAAHMQQMYREQALTFEQRAARAYSQGDMETYKTLSQMAMNIRQMAAQTAAGLITGQPPQVPMPAEGAAPQPNGPQAQGTGGGGGFDMNAAIAEAKRRGMKGY